MTFFRIIFKSSNYSYHSRKKVLFFAAPEVVSEFSAAWCLSIVSQAGSASSISFKRVSMGLTVRRKTAKNLAVRRKNERILAVSRKKN